MRVSVLSVAAIGPGFDNINAFGELLNSTGTALPETVVPKAMSLPSTERRRVGVPVRIALAVAEQAFANCQIAPTDAQSVFATSSGDGTNCHQLCEVLASEDRLLSPTKFTNSVHNAAAGYWGIATGSMKASASLCSFDQSLVAGLLEAASAVTVDNEPVVLVAFDAPYPTPLQEKRPIKDALGLALVLAPPIHRNAIAHLQIELANAQQAPTPMTSPVLESLRVQIPAARGLPLLGALTESKPAKVVLTAMAERALLVSVEPCN